MFAGFQRFGGQVHLDDIGLLEDVEDADDAVVFGPGIAAHDDAEIRIVGAELDESRLQGGDIHLLFVEEEFTGAIDGDVVGLAGRILGPGGGGGEVQVEVIDDRGGGDDEDDEQDEGEIEQGRDIQLGERMMILKT